MAISAKAARRKPVEDGVTPPWVGQRMTLEEFLALPEAKPNLEYDDGVVRQKASARIVHGSVQATLGMAFGQIARANRLGLALIEVRFITPRWVPVPDVTFYRRERIRRCGGRLPEDMFEAPDLAVEIVSPEDSVTQLIAKCLRYLTFGTTVSVLVDPDQETVLTFRPDQPLRILQGQDRIDLDDVLPGFELTVRGLFDATASEFLDEDESQTVEEAVTQESV